MARGEADPVAHVDDPVTREDRIGDLLGGDRPRGLRDHAAAAGAVEAAHVGVVGGDRSVARDELRDEVLAAGREGRVDDELVTQGHRAVDVPDGAAAGAEAPEPMCRQQQRRRRQGGEGACRGPLGAREPQGAVG
jgi:hypothetical protein